MADDTTETAVVVFLDDRRPTAFAPSRPAPGWEELVLAPAALLGRATGAARDLATSLARRVGASVPPPARRRLERLVRRALTLGLAVTLAFVPGTLIVAAVLLVWQRQVDDAQAARDAAIVRHIHHVAHKSVPIHAAPHALAAHAPRPAERATAPPAHAARSPTKLPERPEPKGTADLVIAPPPTPHPPVPASCSAHAHARVFLENAAELPRTGRGFAQLFPHRHLDYATGGLVAAIERAARTTDDAGAPPLMVLNMAGPQGNQAGQDPFHPAAYNGGHATGRAVDLAFFVRDALGRAVPAVESTLEFDDRGVSLAGTRRLYLDPGAVVPGDCVRGRIRGGLLEALCPVPAAAYRIDFDRTWRLVAALLTDPGVGIVDPDTGKSLPEGDGRLRFIFVAKPLKRRLLDAARRAGAPAKLVQLASIVLHPPTNTAPYDHYLHVDVWCTGHDKKTCGCSDGSGPWRRWREGAQVLPRTPHTLALSRQRVGRTE